LGIVILAVFFWPEAWARWIVIIAAGLLAIMSLFYRTCCCANLKKAEQK
jgi:hypothetical protein